MMESPSPSFSQDVRMLDTPARRRKIAPITPAQAAAVLDALSDGVVVLIAREDDELTQTGFVIELANRRFARLLREESASLVGQSLISVFPPARYHTLHDAVSIVHATGRRQRLDLEFVNSVGLTEWLVHINRDSSGALGNRIVMTTREKPRKLSSSAANSMSLAAQQIGDMSVFDASRRELEREIMRLRARTDQLERTSVFDPVSGVLNRKHFLERAAAEFQRSLRYATPLSVVIIEIGKAADDQAVLTAAQCCESNCRTGVDIVGQTEKSRFAILLPETDLSGAIQCGTRLRTLLNKLGDVLKVEQRGVAVGIDTLVTQDYTFLQVIGRAEKMLEQSLQ